jgi:hypothetical protein
MGRIQFNYGRWSRSSTIIDAIGVFPTTALASNVVLRPHPGEFWQSDTNGASQWIRFQTDGSTTWDQVAVLYSNLRLGDTWQVFANTSLPVTTSPTYDSGVLPCFASGTQAASEMRPVLHRTLSTRTEPYMQVFFYPPPGQIFVKIGAMMIDASLKPARNYSRGLRLGPPAQFTIEHLSLADASALHDAALAQEGKPAYVAFDPDETQYGHLMSVYGRNDTAEGLRWIRRDEWAMVYKIDPYV